MAEKSFERAARLEMLLPRIMRALYQGIDEEPLGDLPLAQLRMVRTLYGGPRTVTALGEELGLTASAVTQMANRLQEAKLVERLEDPEDRRIKHLSLSKLGVSRMRARREHRIAGAKAILDTMPEKDQATVMKALELLLAACQPPQGLESVSMMAEIENALPLVPHRAEAGS